MNERMPQPVDPDDMHEQHIEHLMDTLGLSHDDARRMIDGETRMARSEQSAGISRLHTPSRRISRPDAKYTEGFEVVDTEPADEAARQQLLTGIAAVRAASIESQQRNMTPEQLKQDNLRRQARADRRARGY